MLVEIGKRVLELRKFRRLSQAGLLECIHAVDNGEKVAQETLSRIERDKMTPSAEMLVVLAQAWSQIACGSNMTG